MLQADNDCLVFRRTAHMPSTGTIIQVIGSTFDAQFPEEDLSTATSVFGSR